MPDGIGVRIVGEAEVIHAMRALPRLADRVVDITMRKALALLLGDVKPYPPQPPRDRAKTFNCYVRGIGTFPRSSFAGGERKQRGAYEPGRRGGTVRRTSERLGTKWTRRVVQTGGGWRGILGNTASYADFVQGRRQPYYHLQTGWKTIWAALTSRSTQIAGMFRYAGQQIVEAFNRLAGG